MHVVIFEGSHWNTFAPLALSRPVFMLGTGMSLMLDKQIRHLNPTRLTLWVRPELEESCRERIAPKLKIPVSVNTPLDDEPAMVVSGRTLHFRRFDAPSDPAVVLDEGGVVRMAYTRCPGLSRDDVWNRTDRWLKLTDLPAMPQVARLVGSLWDLIQWNDESLMEDSTQLQGKPKPKPAGPYHLINDEDVWLGEGVTIAPGVVLDASNGAIVLAEHVSIGANCVIEGPCYLGPYNVVRPLSMVRGGTSTGPFCKLGGEISNSIILGYTNKVHDGFLGDSYLGKWVNFGAGTTTSNLKNTYGEINIQLGTRTIPTGRRFLGSLVGDHTKTAINTRFGAGTYVGFCCMLGATNASPKFIPSYTFLGENGAQKYELERAIEVTQRVFARRDRKWTDDDERIMRYVQRVAPTVEQ